MKLHIEVLCLLLLICVEVEAAPKRKKRRKRKILKKRRLCDGKKCPFDISDLSRDLSNIGSITLELEEGVTKTFTQAGAIKSRAFHGESGRETMNLVVREELQANDSGGSSRTFLFGSVSDGEKLYKIAPDEFGNQKITETLWEDYPEESDPLPPPSDDDHERQRRTANAFNFSIQRKISSVVDPPFEIDENGHQRQIAFDDSGKNIDVMVVWTKDAECANSDLPKDCSLTAQTIINMLGLIDLAFEETNTAYELSGITTRLRLVHAYRDENYTESTTADSQIREAIIDLSGKLDGNMDDVHSNRDVYGADIVALIVASRKERRCGIGYVGPHPNSVFSATKWSCTTGYFSFGHEIAHNMGCLHDVGDMDDCGTGDYCYGWRDPGAAFRTIQATFCSPGQCDANIGSGPCTRIQRFSTPRQTYQYNDTYVAPLGSAAADNARQIDEVSSIVAGYKSAINCVTDAKCNAGQLLPTLRPESIAPVTPVPTVASSPPPTIASTISSTPSDGREPESLAPDTPVPTFASSPPSLSPTPLDGLEPEDVASDTPVPTNASFSPSTVASTLSPAPSIEHESEDIASGTVVPADSSSPSSNIASTSSPTPLSGCEHTPFILAFFVALGIGILLIC